jgi:hypothetical protein
MAYGEDRKFGAATVAVVIVGLFALIVEAALFVGLVQTLASA